MKNRNLSNEGYSIECFTEDIVKALKVKLGPEYIITARKQLKNNSTRLDGVLIRKDGSNIAPTIYINDFYERHINGEDFDALAEELFEKYKECEIPPLNASSIIGEKPGDASEKVFFRLINRDMNQELLEKVPHRCLLDFAITYHIFVSANDDTMGSVLITDDNCGQFGFDEETLYQLALKNTPRLFPMEIKTMGEVLRKLSGLEDGQLPDFFGAVSSYPMYVISNSRLMNGAACLLYPQFKKEMVSRLPNGYFILPSSVHELIVVPDEREADDLLQMVYDVNRTQVPKEDFLSNNIYRYQVENREISIIVNECAEASA